MNLLLRHVAVVVGALALMSVPASMTVPADGAGAVVFAEDFEGQAPNAWMDGESRGAWRAVYNGFGTTAVAGDTKRRYLVIAPRRATRADETHAGLVVTSKGFDNVDVVAHMWTIRQLKSPANAWEVPWLLWNYTDDKHFYSVVLKPNGWEVGKEDPAYPGAQRFLRTGTTPTFDVGTKHTVRVRQVGDEISVWGDDTLLTTYTDLERPYRKGSIGLYAEDAQAAFDVVVVRRP